jgi:hypothetical protein
LRNPKVRAETIKINHAEMSDGPALDAFEPEPIKRPPVVSLQTAPKKVFQKMPDEVAQSEYWVRNEPIPHGLDLFPPANNLWFMRYADLCYAHSKGGPLFIDTPGSSTEIMYCEAKLAAYRKKGIRYTYIKAHDEISDVLMRLDPMLPVGQRQ